MVRNRVTRASAKLFVTVSFQRYIVKQIKFAKESEYRSIKVWEPLFQILSSARVFVANVSVPMSSHFIPRTDECDT